MTKEELIGILVELANGLKADANTFLWAKSQTNFASELVQNDKSIYRMGGGNFPIALSSLAFVSLLAKIYKILITDDCKELFKENDVFKDETGAVKDFIKKINNQIRIIENIENNNRFWKLLRHGLAHVFLPKGNSRVSAIDHLDFKGVFNFYSYVKSLNSSPNVAANTSNQNGGYDCYADLLAVRAFEAGEWMKECLIGTADFSSKENYIAKLFD